MQRSKNKDLEYAVEMNRKWNELEISIFYNTTKNLKFVCKIGLYYIYYVSKMSCENDLNHLKYLSWTILK